MKKALVVMLFIAGMWLWLRQNPRSQLLNPLASTPTPSRHKIITVHDNTYAYAMARINEPAKLALILNYSEQSLSADLVASNSCKIAINGGFYDEQNYPLGLVISNGQLERRQKTSSLFNGFFSVSASGSALIDYTDFATDNIAIQSGPIVINRGRPVDLQLTDDKTSRRMIVAIADEKVIFLSVFNPAVEVLGPRLDDLPDIVAAIARQEQLAMTTGLNLDGGKASSFYSPEIILTEVTPVGSLLCMR